MTSITVDGRPLEKYLDNEKSKEVRTSMKEDTRLTAYRKPSRPKYPGKKEPDGPVTHHNPPPGKDKKVTNHYQVLATINDYTQYAPDKGLTAKEIENLAGLNHGQTSGALSAIFKCLGDGQGAAKLIHRKEHGRSFVYYKDPRAAFYSTDYLYQVFRSKRMQPSALPEASNQPEPKKDAPPETGAPYPWDDLAVKSGDAPALQLGEQCRREEDVIVNVHINLKINLEVTGGQ